MDIINNLYIGFKHYRYQPGDTRKDLVAIASFFGHLAGTKRAAILALLAGGLMTGEVTGINDIIRQKLSSVLMTPPDQGGPLQSLHNHLRMNCHPDGEGMQ